ncbi:MAG: cytochrome c oxidase subunit 3 [Candidatus Acidiferrales bacterium]|jgi:cytochrome c oxidase subunit 3/cytochrome o ubiquinol oxidase subunit 3
MSAIPAAMPASETPWKLPSRGKVGMLSLIVAESAIFTIFIVAYIFYIGKSLDGPTPRQILTVPIFTTICLLSSSLTMHWAVAALRKSKTGTFRAFWFVTLALGAIFLIGTGREWHHLIYQEDFTITTNLFGTTYYSLVGLHASHVAVGLIVLTTVMVLALLGKVKREHSERCEVISLYWHFVDAVWVVVFTVVYIVGR